MRCFATSRFKRGFPALVVVAGLVLAGCAGDAASDDSAVVAVQSFGGETPLSWYQSGADKALWGSMYDPLIRTNADTGEFEPGLALSWTPSEDYKEWTFKLREGVKFHDGTEMTSADVAFTVEQYLSPEAQANFAGILQQTLDRVETPADDTVVLVFKKPTWELLSHLAEDQPFSVVPKAYVEKVGEEEARANPIGTGRYRFESASPDAYTFTRFEDYWDAENAAGFDEMEIKLVTDPAAGVAGLRSGSLDAAIVFGDGLRQAEQADMNIARRDGFVQYWIVLPGQVSSKWPDYCPECPWVGDDEKALKVREAMNLAVDKQAIIDGIWAGAGTLDPYSHWVFPNQEAWSETFEVPGYDPDRAKQLLAEAGYPDGFDINITSFRAATGQDAPEIIQAVANDWARVGIQAKVTDGDQATFIPKVRARDTGTQGQLYASSYWASEPATLWGSVLSSTSPLMLLAESPEIDADLAAILADVDPESRTVKTQALATKLWERKYGVMLGSNAITWALSDQLDNSWTPGPYALNARFYDMQPAN